MRLPAPPLPYDTTEHIVHVPVIKKHGVPYADIEGDEVLISFDSISIRDYFEGTWFRNLLLGDDSGLPLFLPPAYHFKLVVHHYDTHNSTIACAKICRTIYTALVLNDDIGSPWATRMELGLKTIETRFKAFKYRGDLIICCGNLYDAVPMTKDHEQMAMIEAVPGRVAHATL